MYFIIRLVDLDYFLVVVMIDEKKGLVVVMIEYFELLKVNDKDLFDCIFFLVLNGFYDE